MPAGLLAVLGVICLSLILYCWPLSKSSHSAAQIRHAEPAQQSSISKEAEADLPQATGLLASFLGSKNRVDDAELGQKTGTKEELRVSSGKSGTELLGQPFEDSLQRDDASQSLQNSSEVPLSLIHI